MEECFDIGNMLEKDELDEDFNKKGMKSLETVLKKARYDENETQKVKEEYVLFKERLYQLHQSNREGSKLVRMYENILNMQATVR